MAAIPPVNLSVEMESLIAAKAAMTAIQHQAMAAIPPVNLSVEMASFRARSNATMETRLMEIFVPLSVPILPAAIAT
jgi:hypothetical protein